jgi:hypothetical protein
MAVKVFKMNVYNEINHDRDLKIGMLIKSPYIMNYEDSFTVDGYQCVCMEPLIFSLRDLLKSNITMRLSVPTKVLSHFLIRFFFC